MFGYILAHVCEAIIAGQFFANFFGPVKKIKFGTAIVLAYTSLCMIVTGQNTWINHMVFIMVNAILIYWLYGRHLKESIFYGLIMDIIMSITELMPILFISWYNGGFGLIKAEIPYMFFMILLGRMLYFLFLQFFGKIFVANNTTDISLTGYLLICIVPVISIMISINLTFFLMNESIENNIKWPLVICELLLLIMNVFVFWLHDYIVKINTQIMQMELQKQTESSNIEYYTMLAEQNDHQRILIHDIKNHLQVIRSLGEAHDDVGFTSYINQLMDSEAMKRGKSLAQNRILNSVLVKYASLCEQKHIQFNVDIRKDSLNEIEDNDLVALFGNLVENGMEAAEGTEDAYVDLSVEYRQEEKQVLITMTNSCKEKPQFDKNYSLVTRKKDIKRHGIGTRSIEKIVNKYKGDIKYYYEDEEEAFHTVAVLYPER